MRILYRVFRSIAVTVVFTMVGLLLLLYAGLSLPSVQNLIRERAEKELSLFLDTKVEIGEIQFIPFNQAVVKDICIYDRQNRKALQIERTGSGIALWRLLWHGELTFTHAELIGMRADIIQESEGMPLNIQFIIDAFKPEDTNKPPTKFDFRIRHIVIRGSTATFNRMWKPKGQKGKLDVNHIHVSDIAADIALPRMRNDDFNIEVRRLRLREASGLSLDKLACTLHLSPRRMEVSGLEIEMPRSSLRIPDMTLDSPEGNWQFLGPLRHGRHRLTLENARICPADLQSLVPDMGRFTEVFDVDIDIYGNLDGVDISRLSVTCPSSSLALQLQGSLYAFTDKERFKADIRNLHLNIDGNQTARIVEMLSRIDPSAAGMLHRLGHLVLNLKANVTSSRLAADLQLGSALGTLKAKGSLSYPDRNHLAVTASAATAGFDIGTLLARTDLGTVAVTGNCDILIDNSDLSGSIKASVPFAEYNGKRWQNIEAEAERDKGLLQLIASVNDPDAMLKVNGKGSRNDAGGMLDMTASVQRLNIGALPVATPLGNAVLSGELAVDVRGNCILDLDGKATLKDFHIDIPGKGPFELSYVELQSLSNEYGERTATVRSPYLNGTMQGRFSLAQLPVTLRNLISPAFPSFIKPAAKAMPHGEYATLNITIGSNDRIAEYFRFPVRLLEDVTLDAEFNETEGTLKATLDVPYMLQGRDKLIRDTRLTITTDRDSNIYNLSAVSTVPSKSNEVTLRLGVNALNDSAFTTIGWKVHRAGSFGGDIKIATMLRRDRLTGTPEVDLSVLPSMFDINDITWHVAPASIRYAASNLSVEGVRIWSGDQFASIEGRASTSEADTITMRLQDIDLDYIFSTLGINFVSFGGRATGRFTGTRLFSSSPVAYTDSLSVKGLTYNQGLLGDALIRSHYDARNAEVTITADIAENGKRAALVDGGIWVKRDSLSFAMDADKVNIKFLQPFMQAFTSEVEGRASGNALLYGTFKDIDLKGKLFADTIALRLDFTNTVYSGSDSLTIHPGYIGIPAFRLYDKYGNSAILHGWLRHKYFHEPSFEFNITNARNLLCYDTDASLNPIWYGTIFGNGGASIKGRPGIVNILVDMSTAPKSVFTFVLSDTQEAGEYKFLTFTDRRKEAEEAARPDTIPELRRKYMRMVQQQTDNPSAYVMDLRASVTPAAEMILVMDPVAGDKIRAYGTGALQMGYGSADDRLTMYGRYTLDRGSYNFSLQDLILKKFTIRPGSTISFNGDPYSAQLDIDALYRVNTNLTDLDPSFANDRELNRTNVPVDAVLKVSGDMRQPDVKFDIELPTLTEDMARKVKSVVSTDDMMSRQIIYLLALNRFYTPEYMGGQGSNNEFASIASTTLSSHLTNILGQLSPNWSFAPNLRTDQGDFSDLEVDLALSSRLFNNRLLLNGNFGYRDRTTSSTTFIGDFDLEYLLNRSGSLRLKAYNHFNDQNYYLKSALTTQGIGVVYKHDFDRWFSFLRPKRRKKTVVPVRPAPMSTPDTLLRFR